MNHHTNTNITLLLLIHNSSADLEKHFLWVKKCKTINEIVVVSDVAIDSNKEFFNKNLRKEQRLVFKNQTFVNFSNQRNYALQFCSNKWTLWLDPDEEITNEFYDFINNFKPEKIYSAYSFIRREFFLKHLLSHGPTTKDHLIRLFKKNTGSFVGDVHETWKTTEKIKNQHEIFYHHSNHTVTIFLNKINFYSSIRAQELYDKKTKVTVVDIFLYPLAKFIEIYFLNLGILDGIHGTIFSFGLSFHSFLVRSKLWHLYSQSAG